MPTYPTRPAGVGAVPTTPYYTVDLPAGSRGTFSDRDGFALVYEETAGSAATVTIGGEVVQPGVYSVPPSDGSALDGGWEVAAGAIELTCISDRPPSSKVEAGEAARTGEPARLFAAAPPAGGESSALALYDLELPAGSAGAFDFYDPDGFWLVYELKTPDAIAVVTTGGQLLRPGSYFFPSGAKVSLTGTWQVTAGSIELACTPPIGPQRSDPTSDETVRRKLAEMGYSLQAKRKSLEGTSPAERDEQFRNINRLVRRFLREGNPVLSVDTKKKERVGNFKNAGRMWRPRGEPAEVNVYDFPHLGEGPAIPYGAYDVGRNSGFVNIGTSHDTAEFAVESLRRWWRLVGRRHYPTSTAVLLCADGGGSNGFRNRAWKYHLQQLADQIGAELTVCHYPPGTSKWNKSEHRMFSFISLNWKGRPLVSYETVVNLIGATRTRAGLRVKAALDSGSYELGVKIPDDEMERLHLKPHRTLPAWNYTLVPREK